MKVFWLIISYLGKIFLVVLAPLALFRSFDVLLALMALISASLAFLPLYLANRRGVNFPIAIDLAITAALLVHNAGVFFHWYTDIPNYGNCASLFGTFVIAALAYFITIGLISRKKLQIGRIGTIIVAATFTIAIGAIWEIGEFGIDLWLKLNAQHGNGDTMGDLVAYLIAAIVTPTLLTLVFRGKAAHEQFVEPILAIFAPGKKEIKESEIFEGIVHAKPQREEPAPESQAESQAESIEVMPKPFDILGGKSLDSIRKIF